MLCSGTLKPLFCFWSPFVQISPDVLYSFLFLQKQIFSHLNHSCVLHEEWKGWMVTYCNQTLNNILIFIPLPFLSSGFEVFVCDHPTGHPSGFSPFPTAFSILQSAPCKFQCCFYFFIILKYKYCIFTRWLIKILFYSLYKHKVWFLIWLIALTHIITYFKISCIYLQYFNFRSRFYHDK